MPGYLSPLLLLRNPAAAPLFLSRVVSSASVGFGQLALAWGVLDLGYGAQGLSLVMACNAFPALLMICGGVAGDCFRRHHVLMGAETLACISWLAIGAALFTGKAPLALLCVLGAVGGVATAMFLPTLRDIIADLLDPAHRPAGNALVTQTQSVGLLVGLVSSGAMVTALGPAWAASVRGGLCGLSTVLLSRLITSRPTGAGRGTRPLRELLDGWHEFAARHWLWIMTLQSTAITTAVVCYTKIAGPLYTANGHGDAWAWGVINACEPLGAMMGALLGARWRPARSISVAALLPMSVAAPMLLMGAGAPWQPIAVAALIPGVLQAVYYVLWTTALQNRLESAVLVRVNSWNMVTCYALMPFIMLASGPLAALFGSEALAFWTGVTAVIATLLTLATIRLSERRIPLTQFDAEGAVVGSHQIGSREL
ncbi:MFS transporter [Actinomadura fibrosa]|uniref:MFS transporter n=1 Tax=Actinomadura fibrosa TaxID=111802 RepID=A0ABW2Y7W3_9ACTN|nr:MFS transporter [Actinomadura fibrosa]